MTRSAPANEDSHDAPPWLANATCPAKDFSLESASQTIESLFDWLDARGIESLDYSSMSSARINPEHATACLRSVFLSRHDVPGWHLALRACYDAFLARGAPLEETCEILMGLLPEPIS